MAIDKNSGAVITLTEAQTYVQDFRVKYPNEVKGLFVGSNQLQKIISQEDCIGVRIYNGYDTVEKRITFVCVGVNSSERDMTSGIILQRFVPCPGVCDSMSPLY